MKRILMLCGCCIALWLESNAQANCSNPAPVTICPDTTLLNQTNAGMVDDCPYNNLVGGEDLVYKITTTSNVKTIFIKFTVAGGGGMRLQLANSCSGGIVGSSIYITNANGTYQFVCPVTIGNNFFLWVDGINTLNYTLMLGADTATTIINIPNTQGQFQFDSSMCALPVFSPNKGFLQVSYNSVFQTNPMTLAPLNVPGTMCLSVFLKNTSGVEAIKSIKFDFDLMGYTAVSAPATLPGFYNAGTWNLSGIGNSRTYTFADAALTGKGDFTGSQNSCLRYDFCFTITPLSNLPALTNILIWIMSDGKGSGYFGYGKGGCCPSGWTTCLGSGSGGPTASAHGFGTGINDPGALPVEMLSFDATLKQNKTVALAWETASELNNDYFTVERSADSKKWTEETRVEGAGTCNTTRKYGYVDTSPLQGVSYYRIRQTDYNGDYTFSDVRDIDNSGDIVMHVFPNPASESVMINAQNSRDSKVMLLNSIGRKIVPVATVSHEGIRINTSDLQPGLYMLLVEDMDGGRVLTQQLVIAR